MVKFKLRFVEYVVGALAGWYLLYLIAVGLISSPSGQVYAPKTLDPAATDNDKAAVLAEGVVKSIEDCLDSSFGWEVNDLFFVPQLMDNTPAYQHGVIYATRPASDILAKTAARFGKTDTIDKRLADATSRFFTYSEKVWGFWFIYDCEGKYREGIKNWRAWAQSVGTNVKNAGIYNLKSDDIYEILKYCSSMIDYSIGILNNEQMSHFDADDNVFFTKGICSVVGNMLRSLLAVDSSIAERGGQENVDEALRRLDYIAGFNPLYVVAGGNDAGDAMLPNHVAALARHIDVAGQRINDLMRAMEK